MLTLYHNGEELPLDITEYYVRELASGLDEIVFDMSIWDSKYRLIQEEDNIVDRGGQRYLVKQIDAGATTAKLVCQLDLDEWKATLSVGYNSGTKTVAQQIDAVKPTGWTVNDRSGSSIGRTIKGDLTPLQVCEECRKTYLVYIRWDNKTKTCTIYPQAMGQPVGSFATRELNLKEINYKGKSNNFATRLYAYGKDGLSFADINSGKPYVDNNTYSSRVICAYWSDERYTDKASLLADAQEKLAVLAVPERSYDCAIVDLQATNQAIYNNLDFSLFTVATLIDDAKETAIDYQVVERHVWPYHPDRNDVIFNSAPVKIQDSVIQIEDEITNPNSTFQQIQQARIAEATDWLLNGDGYVVAVQDNSGNWKELLFMDTNDISTAQKVIRINENGIGFSTTGASGPYTNAWTIDGQLNADFITTGTLTANLIKAGVLEDLSQNISWDLATGALTAQQLSINSTNFQLDTQGNVTAKNANVSGTVTSEATTGLGVEKTILDSGRLVLTLNNVVIFELLGGDTVLLQTENLTPLEIDGVGATLELGHANGGGIDRDAILQATNDITLSAGNDITLTPGSGDDIVLDGDARVSGTLYTGDVEMSGDLYVNGTQGWTGTINGVSDGNGNYGDIDVTNGIITGWSGWS
jgi:hypothetical protein